MKTIIAGGRKIHDKKLLWDIVKDIDFDITEIVSGCANGVDTMGEKYAKWANIPVKQFPADWGNLDLPGARIKENEYGKYNATAGLFRNDEMARYAGALILIWDGESSGSRNMLELAEEYGLVILEKVIQ